MLTVIEINELKSEIDKIDLEIEDMQRFLKEDLDMTEVYRATTLLNTLRFRRNLIELAISRG